jgi:tryptophan synthase alpha chain
LKDLVAYITPKIENNSFTTELILSLKDSGVDKIELGIPFSDPSADGPIIEKANFISLNNGFKSSDLFEISKNINDKIDTFWMGYFNSFYSKGDGVKNIIKIAKRLNIKGFVIPDLPFEEAEKYKNEFCQSSVALIDFITPLTPKDRVKMLLTNSREFIYLVAYAGITGTNKQEDLTTIIQNIKESSNTKLYIGFGVDKQTAKDKSKGVDGVIVGSAFIKILIDDSLSKKRK